MDGTLQHIVNAAGTVLAGVLLGLFLAYLLAAATMPLWIDRRKRP